MKYNEKRKCELQSSMMSLRKWSMENTKAYETAEKELESIHKLEAGEHEQIIMKGLGNE